MSIVSLDVADLILKLTVPPMFVLICVAKPTIESSPASGTYQSDGGEPGRAFSQATGFPHAACDAAGDAANSRSAATTRSAPARHGRATISFTRKQRARRAPPRG